MPTTVTIDDALYEMALPFAGPAMGKADLLREAIKRFVRVQAVRRQPKLTSSASATRNFIDKESDDV